MPTKRPRDPNQLAKMIVDMSTGAIEEDAVSKKKKRPAAQRAGGLIGGKSRAKKLTPEERSDIARLAAQARWKKSR